jgi:hypothetical protein
MEDVIKEIEKALSIKLSQSQKNLLEGILAEYAFSALIDSSVAKEVEKICSQRLENEPRQAHSNI